MKKVQAKQIKIHHTFLLRVAPWYALTLGMYGLLIGLTTVNLSPFATSGGLQMGTGVLISGLLLIIANLLLVFSFKKLLHRKKAGWRYFVLGQIINLLSAVVLVDLFRVGWDIVVVYLLFILAKYYK